VVSEAAFKKHTEVWHRFLPVVLEGLHGEHAEPLPGKPVQPDECDAVVRAGASQLGRSHPSR
jgi:hypothetical protein